MKIKKYQKRPDKGELQMVALRMPQDLIKELDDLSEKHSISRQRLITEVLKAALKDKKLEIYLEV